VDHVALVAAITTAAGVARLLRGLLARCCAGTSARVDGPVVIVDCRRPGPREHRVPPYAALRAAGELWLLAAERAWMLPLEYVRAAGQRLGSEIDLARTLAAESSDEDTTRVCEA